MKNALFLLVALIAVHSTYTMEETPPSPSNEPPITNQQLNMDEAIANLIASFKQDVESEAQPLYSAEDQSHEQIETLRRLIQELITPQRGPTPIPPEKELPPEKTEIPTNFLDLIDNGYVFYFFDSARPDKIIVYGKKIDTKLTEEWLAPRTLKEQYIKLQGDRLMKTFS